MNHEEVSILDDLLADDSDRMTDWEITFIEDMNRRRDRDLTEKQADRLQQIWSKLFDDPAR